MRTGKRTSNSIISPAGEPRPTVCVSSAVQNVSDLEDRSDAGCYNCCFSVDIVSVRFSCRQSRTVYCVEAFVRRPVMTVCACLLCKCVSVCLVVNRTLSRLCALWWSWSCRPEIWFIMSAVQTALPSSSSSSFSLSTLYLAVLSLQACTLMKPTCRFSA